MTHDAGMRVAIVAIGLALSLSGFVLSTAPHIGASGICAHAR